MGAICPKGKHSGARRDKRRAQSFRIPGATLSKCPKCGALVKPHRACRSCGTYKSSEVLNVG
ncbi:MAG: 50S ribosomal protein L32 [Clostridiales bacterium]|jgi:large subunit ribosomal protein L32|nr:50S ribosomal protein L32 [Clostridiales bacterium]